MATEKQQKLVEVGITERVGTHRRISAVTKNRYSDFHVNEIGPDGKQVRLTDLGPPRETKKTVDAADEALQAVLPPGTVEKVDALQKVIDEQGWRKGMPVEIDVTNLDKDDRTKIHRWISGYASLSSSTVDKDNRKIIFVEYASNRMKNSRRPETRAKFTHCVLYKEGMETSDAIMLIAKKLKMRPSLITYCGTKDKRAKTTQRICVSNTEARRLIEISNQMRNLKLGNFEYSPKHLFLGDLKGNHFKLLLKNAKLDEATELSKDEVEEALQAAVSSFEKHGFINYYGLQRFGSFEVSTHAVGKALLQNKWDKVFDLLLQPKDNDPDFMQKAKKKWFENRNAVEIVKLLPNWHRSIESNLIYGLSRHYDQKDYVSAFLRIPRNVRILYVHAFQSYLWNMLASERIRKYGMKPVVGDIVFAEDKANLPLSVVEDVIPENSDMEILEVLTVSENNGKVTIPIKVLKEDDLSNYTIFDVLIPLFGSEVDHKDYFLRDYYDNLLLENGLLHDCFANYKPRQDAPRGSYRNLVVKPENVSHRVIPYAPSEDTDKLILSDYEILKAKDSCTSESVSTEIDMSTKTKLCVAIEFSLPSSSYATMALREILSDDVTAKSDVQTEKRSAESFEDNDKNGNGSTEPESKKIRTD